jgi:hypothetical protein
MKISQKCNEKCNAHMLQYIYDPMLTYGIFSLVRRNLHLRETKCALVQKTDVHGILE